MNPDGASSILLDTCTVIDLAGEPHRIADSVLTWFARPTTRLFVSAVSAWEVSIKTERGRLAGGAVLIAEWDETLRALRAEPVDIAHGDALDAGSLDWEHRDPFDRMLVAQALRFGMPLATRDDAILESGLVNVVDTRTHTS